MTRASRLERERWHLSGTTAARSNLVVMFFNMGTHDPFAKQLPPAGVSLKPSA
jgi:hypothetical protein